MYRSPTICDHQKPKLCCLLYKMLYKIRFNEDKDGEGFSYLRGNFPQLSDAKGKEGIFLGPPIRKLMKDKSFKNAFNIKEKAAWEVFEKVVKGFLGNKRPENYVKNVNELLEKYHELGISESCSLNPQVLHY